MGSKVIGFRVPYDLAEEFKHACEERGQTTSEVLRQLVDDMLYPNREEAALSTDESVLGRLDVLEGVYEVLGKQLKDFDERLELVQVNRGLTETDREHYDKSLADLSGELANLKSGVNKLVHTVNNNVEVCNESFKRVSRLFQFLDAHQHDSDGMISVSPKELLEAEVQLANKRVGELPDTDQVKPGRFAKPGWKFLEYLDLSVRE